jgi:CARDB
MRTWLAIAALVVTVLPTTPSFAAGGNTPAFVKTVKCSVAQHEAAFYARMRDVAGSDRMAMRFTLLERTGAEGFVPVRAPGLGRWHRSRSGVGVFGYRQAVRNLLAIGIYRMKVDFRWYSPEGDVVEQLHRRSSACRQYEALPNLRAEVLGARDGAVRGVVRYSVRVSNEGRAVANTVPVTLTVDGDAVDTVTVPTLEPGENSVITIRGPACRSVVEAEADPDGTIAESSEDDNAHAVACGDLAA